jgi:hypothetical protein
MDTNNTKNTNLSDLSRVSEQLKNSHEIDFHEMQDVIDFMSSFNASQHTTEIVNEFKKVGLAGPGSGLFNTLKNLGKIDEDRTRLIESIPAYAPCLETNMYYYVTTDGCIVNSRTLQVTELDESFWEYLEVFQQEL